MPGYRLVDVDESNLPAKYLCSLCGKLLRDAVQTACGHLYCESCLEQCSENFSCKTDGKVIHKNQAFQDRFLRREILALMVHVYCTFQDEGCTWRGEVRHCENHEATCKFMKVHCVHEACGMLVKRGDLGHHLETECSCRLAKCRLCRAEISWHLMKEHHRIYHNHLHCEMDNLRDVVDDILHAQENLENVQRELQDGLQNTTRQLQERRIESTDHTLALRNVTLADLEGYVRQQESSSYDGHLLWKISDYARRRKDAVTGQQVSFYSPCFFTSRYGYKMCARLYLNGDGIGQGTHISVFFVVMRGDYDALLHWPFRQKVTFMLLDQDNVEHVIDAFSPDPSSSSFQKPRREANIASGCPMFCSLAKLNNHAYIRDDTMFLKIIVDTTDL